MDFCLQGLCEELKLKVSVGVGVSVCHLVHLWLQLSILRMIGGLPFETSCTEHSSSFYLSLGFSLEINYSDQRTVAVLVCL